MEDAGAATDRGRRQPVRCGLIKLASLRPGGLPITGGWDPFWLLPLNNPYFLYVDQVALIGHLPES